MSAKAVTGGAVDGAVSEGMMYFTEPGPHTVGGFFGSVAMRGAGGGVFAGAGHALGKVTGWVRNACFTGDTEVLMADGTATTIDEIVVGDQVGAYNPDTDQVEPCEVEAVFIHENVATWTVSTEDGDITTTAAHPFYVEGTGWTEAENLREGDRLRTDTGNITKVDFVAATGETATVHNFTVTELHNYHVATNDGTWVLVHNTCELPDYLSTGRYAEPGHSVYVGEVGDLNEYVGRTNDLLRREADHLRDGRTFIPRLVQGAEVLKLGQARAIEEAIYFTVHPIQNKIASIAESRPFHSDAVKWGTE